MMVMTTEETDFRLHEIECPHDIGFGGLKYHQSYRTSSQCEMHGHCKVPSILLPHYKS